MSRNSLHDEIRSRKIRILTPSLLSARPGYILDIIYFRLYFIYYIWHIIYHRYIYIYTYIVYINIYVYITWGQGAQGPGLPTHPPCHPLRPRLPQARAGPSQRCFASPRPRPGPMRANRGFNRQFNLKFNTKYVITEFSYLEYSPFRARIWFSGIFR